MAIGNIIPNISGLNKTQKTVDSNNTPILSQETQELAEIENKDKLIPQQKTERDEFVLNKDSENQTITPLDSIKAQTKKKTLLKMILAGIGVTAGIALILKGKNIAKIKG